VLRPRQLVGDRLSVVVIVAAVLAEREQRGQGMVGLTVPTKRIPGAVDGQVATMRSGSTTERWQPANVDDTACG